MRRFLILATKKCRIYAACGVSQTLNKIKFRKGEYLKWIDNAVRKSENLADNDKVNKETQPEKVLTLSTCTYGKNRLVLHCILIK